MCQAVELFEAINTRRSIRAFTDKPVDPRIVEEILEAATKAPSALNLQPWEFLVVVDEERERLSRRLLKAYRERRIGCSPQGSDKLPEKFARRMKSTFEVMKAKIERAETDYESFINEGSLNFYGAPVAIIICMDNRLSKYHLLSIGSALAYLVLAAHAKGLGTCLIGLIHAYADEVKDALNIPEEKEVVLGVALGYPDWNSTVNAFKTPRDSVKEVARWI
ncbi:MAG: nitroreductase family protein [Nitrososphaerota archaeon]|nr:nitroreductase family protein [Candidatus Bathyarchaeota archaeon]MDW8023996.1 nitroreductase family protein [Nitrososphaerota archaeon]